MSSALLSQAAELHRAGRLDEAEAIYRQVVGRRGKRRGVASAGDAAHSNGSGTGGRAAYSAAQSRWIEMAADFHLNLAVALLKLSLAGEAANSCQTAIAMRPDWPEAWFNLGCALATMGQGPRAVEAYQMRGETEAGLRRGVVQSGGRAAYGRPGRRGDGMFPQGGGDQPELAGPE